MDKTVEVFWVNKYVNDPPTRQLGDLIVDGVVVPQVVVARYLDPAKDGLFTVTLDARFEIDVAETEIYNWGWLLANAMAISAGFTSVTGPRRDVRFGPSVRALDPGLLDDGASEGREVTGG